TRQALEFEAGMLYRIIETFFGEGGHPPRSLVHARPQHPKSRSVSFVRVCVLTGFRWARFATPPGPTLAVPSFAVLFGANVFGSFGFGHFAMAGLKERAADSRRATETSASLEDVSRER